MTLWLAPTASPPSKGIKGAPESSEACELFLETPGQQSMNNRAKMRGLTCWDVADNICIYIYNCIVLQKVDDEGWRWWWSYFFGELREAVGTIGKIQLAMLTPVGSNSAKDEEEVILFCFFYKFNCLDRLIKGRCCVKRCKRTSNPAFPLRPLYCVERSHDDWSFAVPSIPWKGKGLVDNPAIDQNSSKTSPKEKTPPPFPNYNNNERDKSFNNKKTLWSAKLISPGQWHTAHKIYFSIVKLSFRLFLNKDSNRSFNW